MKLSKNRYLSGFAAIVLLLALVRLVFPSVAKPLSHTSNSNSITSEKSDTVKYTTINGFSHDDLPLNASQLTANRKGARFFRADGTIAKHRIKSVPHFGNAFPDQNDVQLIAANKHGVQPVIDRQEAERRKSELVYVGSNPFFSVDRLHSSIPYLVPRAAVLLQDIGRNFFDSLQLKGVPLHKIIVTSVMRSKADVTKLRGHNGNATQNSCHLYGTTFDVCYNRYKTVEAPNGPHRRSVRNDTLKWILSEVLNDIRKSGRCYIKYEVHQGCFHITVR